jgi:hypothetical protein
MGAPARAVALAILVLCLTAGPAWATEFDVAPDKGEGVDSVPGNNVCLNAATGVCTLRAAVQEANAHAGADVIKVPAGKYSLTAFGGSAPEPNVTNGDLDITEQVTIEGAGARNTTVTNQGADDRLFQVQSSASNVVIKGLTLSDGAAITEGGGFRNDGSSTTLDGVTVGPQATQVTVQGAGIANTGSLAVLHSLITGNKTTAASGGGGIFNDGGILSVGASTISGNQAPTAAALVTSGESSAAQVIFSTITNNASTNPGGSAVVRTGSLSILRFASSIIAINGGVGAQNCSGHFTTVGYNLESGNTCGFTGTGDQQNKDPVLAPLDFSSASDQTQTHVPQPGSPAIDGGGPNCPNDVATDQRGLPRPSGAACDTGAVEVQQQQQPPPPAPPAPPEPKPASLVLDPPSANRTPGDPNTVTATVRNDDGSPAAGAAIRYSVQGANPGDGAVTTGADGTAQISWDGVHEGGDTVAAYVDTNGNLTADLGEPTGQASVTWALPKPQQGRTANIEPVDGVVRITVKGNAKGKVGAAGSTSVLTEARQVPLSTVVDTRKGRVRMTTIANKNGATQQGDFYGGIYTTTQSRSASRAITELKLTEGLSCTSGRGTVRGKVTAARARSRHLWGNARGRYRTRGRHSTATVRGTIWLQKDSCDSTTTVVRRGTVVVQDFAKKKNVTVKAGHRYVARARRR